MDRNRWNIRGLCEMKWKNFGETTTEEVHKVFFCEKDDKREHGVGTGKAFVKPSAMMKQMREDSDFWSLPTLTILCWRTHLVITRHSEDRHGITQMDNTTTRLIIF